MFRGCCYVRGTLLSHFSAPEPWEGKDLPSEVTCGGPHAWQSREPARSHPSPTRYILMQGPFLVCSATKLKAFLLLEGS